ncbi:MAG: thioredoxin [Alphaproteobacteria bacterium]|jgi:putative thioredoxin|nr:thioredoxin [Alphaproteobacteria bacterium]
MEISMGGAPGAGAHVKDSTDQDFANDVIEPSKETPVLVDFWAPWCGPCKTLGPLIEKVVGEKAGKVKLVKVNIDENPQIAGQLGVRSIPAVFAFDQGRPVDGFMGALPEGQIREFIDKIMSGTDEGQQIAEAMDGADQAMQTGDIGGAAQIYAAVINAEPENVRAIAGLARCYLQNGDRERARETLEMTPADKRDEPEYKSVRTALDLMADGPDENEFAEAARRIEADPADHAARYELAENYAAAGRHGPAVDQLLTILEADMNWGEGKAKEKLLTVFEAAGPKDPATIEGRRRLSSLMFA